MLFRALAVSAALICGPVVAATYNYDVSIVTNGTPNPATLNFDIDFDLVTADAAGSSAGLTVNSLNFNLGSTLLARFAGNALVIGGTAGGVVKKYRCQQANQQEDTQVEKCTFLHISGPAS